MRIILKPKHDDHVPHMFVSFSLEELVGEEVEKEKKNYQLIEEDITDRKLSSVNLWKGGQGIFVTAKNLKAQKEIHEKSKRTPFVYIKILGKYNEDYSLSV